jgi:hypothetical protein
MLAASSGVHTQLLLSMPSGVKTSFRARSFSDWPVSFSIAFCK